LSEVFSAAQWGAPIPVIGGRNAFRSSSQRNGLRVDELALADSPILRAAAESTPAIRTAASAGAGRDG
jgi:hypothetical protein